MTYYPTPIRGKTKSADLEQSRSAPQSSYYQIKSKIGYPCTIVFTQLRIYCRYELRFYLCPPKCPPPPPRAPPLLWLTPAEPRDIDEPELRDIDEPELRDGVL